jgi:hypothetical protein
MSREALDASVTRMLATVGALVGALALGGQACSFDGEVAFGEGGGATTNSSSTSAGGGGSSSCTTVADCNGDPPACREWACVDGTCVAEAVPDGTTVSCYEGPPGTEGQGACVAGERSCEGGEPGPCEGQVLPTVEDCSDAIDQSCDGIVECDGAPLWARRLPLGAPPRAAPAQGGGVWIVGARSGTAVVPELAFGGDCAPLSAPEGDAFGFVARFDEAGRCASAFIVASSPGSAQGINPISVAERDDGTLWSLWSFGSPISVGSSALTPAALDGLLVATTPDRQIDWSITIGGTGNESVGSMSIDPGGLVVGGTSSSATIEVLDANGTLISVAGGVDGVSAPILVGVSNDGDVRFVRRSVLSGTEPSASLAPVRGTASGSLVVANVGSNATSFNWVGAASSSPSQGGVHITRFGVDGSPSGPLVFDYPGSDSALSCRDADGSTVLLSGSTFGGVGSGGCPDIAQKPDVLLGYWAALGPGSCSVGTLEAAPPVVGTGDPFVRFEQIDRDASGALFLGATYRGILDGVEPQFQGVHLRKHAGPGPDDKAIWARSFEPGLLIVPLRAYFADPTTGGAYVLMRCSASTPSLDDVLVEGDTSCSELTTGVYLARLRP